MPILTMIKFNVIPQTLKDLAKWVVWRGEERGGKTTKVPYDAKTQKYASVTNPATWATFEQARTAFKAEGFDGVGFVLTKDDPLVGIDLDHCIDRATGVIEPWALAVVDQIHSYTERSPSGNGLRIFVRGTLPSHGRKKGPLELYQDGRYLTVTGNHLAGTPLTIEDRHTTLQRVHAALFPLRNHSDHPYRNNTLISADDETLLKRMFASKNGAKIKQLWQGDWNDYLSQSEADAALCCHLAFWFGRDSVRMERVFRQSQLMRAKWEAPRGGSTYGADCIAKACAIVGATYQTAPAKGTRRNE